MIRITVVSFSGSSPKTPISASFDTSGGNIGRGSGNALVLPDPQQQISRIHAAISFRDGQYIVRDMGRAFPVYLNGRALGPGVESAISEGDELRVGLYVMRVEGRRSAAPAPVDLGFAPPGAVKDDPLAAFGSSPSGAARDDPLAAFGGSPSPDNPFADLVTPQPAPRQDRPSSAPPPQARGGAAGRIEPEMREQEYKTIGISREPGFGSIPAGVLTGFGLDPFAPKPAAKPASSADPFALPDAKASGSRPAIPPDVNLELGAEPRGNGIDDVFGLAPSKAGGDPLAPGAPLGDELPPSFGSGISATPQRDDTPEIRSAFTPGRVVSDTPPTPMSSAPEPVAPQIVPDIPTPSPAGGGRPTDSAGLVDFGLSWEEATQSRAPVSKSDTDTDSRPAAPPPPEPAERAAPASAPRSDASGTPGTELMRAFLAGAGVPDVSLPDPPTPELMAVLGQLFREATAGTLSLLRARTQTKKEMRAEVTVIAPRENNPIKFSPDVETALRHLLAPSGRAFMTPRRALQDAYNDLYSHQIGVMAGMDAALKGVLQRFDPVQLESRLAERSMLDSLVPMHRKAKLWDLFTELFGELTREAEDNFDRLFGAEFQRAYESQIARLERDQSERS